jgi:hypothetical protein
MATICGNCQKVHATAADVKQCYIDAGAITGGAPPEPGNERGWFPSRPARSATRGVSGERVPISSEQLKEGLYRSPDGTEYRVKISGKTRLPYATVLDRETGKFEYAPGRIREIRAEWFVSKDAKGFTDADAGMYRHPETGEILKVYKAVHGSGNMVAKRLLIEREPERDGDTITVPAVINWLYLGLASRFVRGHVKMLLDEAVKFGRIYGVCCRCGRTLTDETSIENGIGPVCIQYFAAA